MFLFNHENCLILILVIALVCSCSHTHTENTYNKSELLNLHRALKNDPKNVDILFRLADRYRKDNDYKKSYKYLSRIIEIDSMNSMAYIIRGEILEEQIYHCINSENYYFTFEDKLVFRLALENYRIAASFSNSKINIERKEEAIGTLADFSHDIIDPPLKTIKFNKDCYSWIKPEIKSRNLIYFITENRFYFRPPKN
jgi:tetratricopeptide (TPR) repeat protein